MGPSAVQLAVVAFVELVVARGPLESWSLVAVQQARAAVLARVLVGREALVEQVVLVSLFSLQRRRCSAGCPPVEILELVEGAERMVRLPPVVF